MALIPPTPFSRSGRRRGRSGVSTWLPSPVAHIITRKRLNEFVSKHPNAEPGLAHWYHTLKPATIRSFVELRALFPSADQVGKLTVFNISGNTVRLIAAIHYNRQKIYIRAVLTHEEYDKGTWKE